MEVFAAVLTGILGIGSSLGIVVDRSVADAIYRQVPRIEHLAVRVDNAPNYQLIYGKIDRIRMASRGVHLVPFLRIDTLEVETDAISLSPEAIGKGKLELLQPLRAAMRVVLLADDINRALAAPEINASFKGIKADFSSFNPALGVQELDIVDPLVSFQEDNRLRLTATLQPRSESVEKLAITAEISLRVLESGNIELKAVDLLVGEVKVPAVLISSVVKGLNRLLDVRQLAERGIVAKVLKFSFEEGKMQLVGFAQINTLP